MKSEIHSRIRPLLSKQFKNYSFVDQTLIQEEEEYLMETLQEKIKRRKKHKKIVTATPLGVDYTQFFDFKKNISSQNSIISQLQGGYCAWLILGYCMFNNSLILPWMISIESQKYLRQAWRHIFLNIILIPFIYYEKRTANAQKRQLYKRQNILKVESLKNAFLVAASKALWFIYNLIAHTLILGSLMNFFLSINRFFSKSYHFLQPGGQIFIMIGIFLIIKDQIFMNPQLWDQTYQITGFTKYDWKLRVFMDVLALFISFVMAMFSQYTKNLNKDYPSYFGLALVNFMIAMMMFLASFFFHGASFDADFNFGIFGVFQGEHFTAFFQLSVFIGFGMLWSYTMISRLFPEPLIPSLSALFEPMFSIMIMDFAGFQQIPSGYTVMGYIFIIPGTFLILIGQNIYQKQQKAEQVQIEQRLKSLYELSRTQKLSHVNQLDSPQLKKNKSIAQTNQFKKQQKQYSDVLSFLQSQNDSQFYSQHKFNKMSSLKQILSQEQFKFNKK